MTVLLTGTLGGTASIATVIFLPPVAVSMINGASIQDIYLNFLLTCFGWIPGVIHAVYLLLVAETRRQNRDYFTRVGKGAMLEGFYDDQNFKSKRRYESNEK